ncbi:MAG: MFS transporter [Anaerolineae bacterium]|nr:MFS transporter [Anaerolineae bacterium]
MTSVQAEVEKHFRHNFIVNLADGSFFGLAMGCASAVTILPLFIAHFTDSTILIGLIGSIHMIGSQLPQILMIGKVARLERYQPLALIITTHERLPFLGLTLLALLSPQLPAGVVVALCYGLFIWHSLGSGFAATPYQSMIGKIFPERRRGMFLGAQMAGYSLLSGLGAVLAGVWLQQLPHPANYAVCFFSASLALAVSWFFLARAREPRHSVPAAAATTTMLPWARLRHLWRSSASFRRFVLARMVAQGTLVTLSFLAIYSTRHLKLGEQSLGLLTGLLFFMQIIGALLGGWLGDRAGHRLVLVGGACAMAAAGLCAALATDSQLLPVIYALSGAGSAILLTNVISMTLEYGSADERPYYIGLANTLTACAAFIAPVVAGIIVERYGYASMFLLAALAGVATMSVLLLTTDPRHQRRL